MAGTASLRKLKGWVLRLTRTTRYQRARAAHEAGRLDEARRLFGEMAAAHPDALVAWKRLAHIAVAQRDWPEAVRTGMAALALDPVDLKLYQILPEAMAEADVPPETRERFDGLAGPNAPPQAFLSLAMMHLAAGDRARGRAWLERHLAAGLEPGPDRITDLRLLASEDAGADAVLRAAAPPFRRKALVSPAFYGRVLDAGRGGLIQGLPRLPPAPEGGWIHPVYFGPTRPLNPAARSEPGGFLLDRIPDVTAAMRERRAVLVLDRGHESLFAHPGFEPRPDLLAFAAHLKAEAIPPAQVLILDGDPTSPALAAQAFHAAGLEGPPVLADRFLWLEAAGMFLQIASTEAGAQARLARGEAALAQPRDKAFLSFNHAPRRHRSAFVAFLLERGLLDRGLVSFRGPDYTRERARRTVADADWLDINVREVARLVKLAEPRRTLEALLALAPLEVDVQFGPEASPRTMAAKANERWPYEATSFSAVTETAFSDGRSSHATEKVIKPIGNLHPFVYIGEPGILAELRNLGFQTFAPAIDEGYDAILAPEARMAALLAEIVRLASLTPDELHAFRRACWPAVRHNYLHLLALAPREAERIAGRMARAVQAATAA